MPSKLIAGPMSEHSIAAFNRGCRCDDCKAASRRASRRRRWAKLAERPHREGDSPCIFCGVRMHPKGLARHEDICRG